MIVLKKMVRGWAYVYHGEACSISLLPSKLYAEPVAIVPMAEYRKLIKNQPVKRGKVEWQYYATAYPNVVRRCCVATGVTQYRAEGSKRWANTPDINVYFLQRSWESISRSEARRILGLKG